jgi:hypothetical protein
MDRKIYLIQGFFWQYLSPQSNDGLLQIIGSRSKFMFAGALFLPASYGSDKKAGEMNDLYGISVLSNVVIEQDCLTFDKKYLAGRPCGVISYSFKREDAIWTGEYSSSIGNGLAKCVLLEVPWNFFTDDARSTCRIA